MASLAYLVFRRARRGRTEVPLLSRYGPSGAARSAAMIELRYGTPRGRWVIAATVLGSGMAQLDATVVGIALPTIGRQFNSGVSTLQWVVTAYTLTLAGLLLLGGALGDRLGRRRMFVVGTIWFAVASLGCGPGARRGPALIAARALQGVGGALLTPGSLAIIQASFSSDDRSRAIGAWSGLGGVAAAIGPFLGGWLISAVSWRLIFFINLPDRARRGPDLDPSRARIPRPVGDRTPRYRRGRAGHAGAGGPDLRAHRGAGARAGGLRSRSSPCLAGPPCWWRSCSGRTPGRATRSCRWRCSAPRSSRRPTR